MHEIGGDCVNTKIEAQINKIKNINSIELTQLKSELETLGMFFDIEMQLNPSEIMEDAVLYRKTLLTAARHCKDSTKSFLLGMCYGSINASIQCGRERIKKEKTKEILQSRDGRLLFLYFCKQNVCKIDDVEHAMMEALKMPVLEGLQSLMDAGLLYSYNFDGDTYLSLSDDGHKYKQFLENK